MVRQMAVGDHGVALCSRESTYNQCLNIATNFSQDLACTCTAVGSRDRTSHTPRLQSLAAASRTNLKLINIASQLIILYLLYTSCEYTCLP